MKIETKKNASKASVDVRFTPGTVSKFRTEGGREELAVAYGATKSLRRRKLVLLLRKTVATAKHYKLKSLVFSWNDIRELAAQDIDDAALGELLAVAFSMADFEFVAYKKRPEDGFSFVEDATVTGAPASAERGMRRGAIVGEEVNACRTLANTPGKDMTPEILLAAARKAVRGTSVSVKALGRAEMKKLGMGAVLGVAQGSVEEPKFIILEYKGGAAPSARSARSGRSKQSQRPIVLIGKGVTFDSGGLNIKPGDSMLEMHMDMSGGAAVIHAIALAARLKVPANVVGLIPAVENMPSGSATRPGDIVKSLSGRTIEILNTDAEGRVILADAITYAKRYDPSLVVEASTLTGASLTALGLHASALMSTDEVLEKRLIEQGEESGDYLWPFPMWEEYEDMVKGNFGDVANIPASGNTRYAGVIGGGMFLREFAKDLSCPFAHLDIAPRMTASPHEHLAKGAIGTPVRLFLKIIEGAALQAK